MGRSSRRVLEELRIILVALKSLSGNSEGISGYLTPTSMNYIFFDTETTSRDYSSGQLVEFSALICNESLSPIAPALSMDCCLRPHIIPEIGALLVTKKTIEDINKSQMSHFKMVSEMIKYAKENAPSIWLGWNTIEFDFKWLRQSMHECLEDPYLYEAIGNKRADALPIARATQIISPHLLKVEKNKRGNPSFKLESLSKTNKIKHDNAHSAGSDVDATLAISKMIQSKSPELWDGCNKTMNRDDAEKLIWSEPIFVSIESFYSTTKGYIMTAICHHPVFNWSMGLDLRVAPETYINLDKASLKKEIRRTPKVLRTIRSSNHPILLDISHKNKIHGYGKISMEELNRRARILQRNEKLKETIKEILTEEAEETLSDSATRMAVPWGYTYDKEAPSSEEKALLKSFHGTDCWDERYEIIKGLRDTNKQSLGLMLVYEENPKTLSRSDHELVWQSIRDRIYAGETAPWNTIQKSREEIKKHTSKKNGVELNIIRSLENHLTKLEEAYMLV